MVTVRNRLNFCVHNRFETRFLQFVFSTKFKLFSEIVKPRACLKGRVASLCRHPLSEIFVEIGHFQRNFDTVFRQRSTTKLGMSLLGLVWCLRNSYSFVALKLAWSKARRRECIR